MTITVNAIVTAINAVIGIPNVFNERIVSTINTAININVDNMTIRFRMKALAIL